MNYIVLDTETANSFDDPMCYDVGWAVIDGDTGEILRERSYVITDIFLNEQTLMENAYFADKIPQYFEAIRNGDTKFAKYENVRKILYRDCRQFGVTRIVAHNARFDYRACQCTQRWLTDSRKRWFFPYGVEFWDSLKMARQVFANDPDYRAWCMENGFTARGSYPRLTAEVLYRYITNDIEFEEAHTGLADVLIEKDIYEKCLEIDPEVDGRLWR